jgi:hypothetical protein
MGVTQIRQIHTDTVAYLHILRHWSQATRVPNISLEQKRIVTHAMIKTHKHAICRR